MQGSSVGVGFFLLLSAVLTNVAAFVAFRYLVGRALGAKGIRVALGLEHRPWIGVSLWRKLLFVLAGPAACYLYATVLIAAGLSIGGTMTMDESSMRIAVMPGGPADVAGFRDGDQIVSVACVRVADWTKLREEVAKHPNEETRFEILRAGEPLVLTPTPNASGKISVGVPLEYRSIGLAEAFGTALCEPPKIWRETFRGLVRIVTGGEPHAISGPVSVVKSASAPSRPGDVVKFIGALNAYYLGAPMVIALLLFPGIGFARRRRVPAAG